MSKQEEEQEYICKRGDRVTFQVSSVERARGVILSLGVDGATVKRQTGYMQLVKYEDLQLIKRKPWYIF